MMEDSLIENNNGLNDISADDGGSSDDETEDRYKPHDDHLGVPRQRRTNVSYSEDDQHQQTHIQNDDPLQPTLMTKRPSPMLDPNKFDFLPLRGSVGSDAFTYDDFLGNLIRLEAEGCEVSLSLEISDGVETQDLSSRFRDDDYLDEVSQMISPPIVIAEARTDCNLNLGTARHTEQRITPSSPLLMNTPHCTDNQEGNSNDEDVHDWSRKMDFEWIFVITNIVLESMSAIFTQLSSKQKPQYALFGMLLSYFALLTCIIELIYEGRRHQKTPIWRRRRGTWYYDRPQRRKSFATLNNIVALACALGQCVVTTINYRFDNPIKVTVLPIILVFGLLFSKTFKYRQREAL